ncbi:MAG: DUF2225 domain-containing protein [Lachnospiraceae bacterium]|nr:DUF2225 domain-containing protein [Lachnospiraceae bacterium]
MDNNLLAGLGDLGLGNLENLEIYETAKKADDADGAAKAPEFKEEDVLFEKSYTCTVCDQPFKTKMIRAGKVKMIGPDVDLRPRYEHVDVLKYDIIACPHCGYAGLSKTFSYLTSAQAKAIKENICKSFKPRPADAEEKIYTYKEALERHKLALVNTIVKHGKASEKAYICLKTGWLLRGETESLDKDDPDYDKKKQENEKAETQFLKNAYDGFVQARASESFPICGMDELTVDYLLAALAVRFGEFDTASRLISSIITSRSANARMKDKAHDLKDMMSEKMKESKAE